MGRYDLFGDPSQYAAYLRGMRRLHLHCRESVRRVSAELNLPPSTDRILRAIEDDLASIHAPLADRGPDSAPPDAANSSARCEAIDAADWGRAYVIEGSAMGGSFMVRSAKDQLPPGSGTQFLQQLSHDAKNRWPVVAQGLADFRGDIDSAVQAAKETFQYAQECFAVEMPDVMTE
ncbi:biliverdin-producing heme oxygenase [Roseiconus nitratireducens]|nr:biliverdin-producing heme oxygenase [Roseiconus nitratireducens]